MFRAFCMYVLVFSLLLFTGCATKEALAPQVPKGLVDFRQGEGNISDLSPFEYHWIDPEFINNPELSRKKYDNFYLVMEPLKYLDESDWEASKNSRIKSKEDYEQRVVMLADYFKKRLTNYYNRRVKKFNITEESGPRTMKVEVAFTEVQFGNPAAYAGAFAVPLPGTSHAFDSMASPMMAFEARIIDKDEQRIIVEMADKKTPRTKPFDLNKFTTNSPMREIVDRWVEESLRSGQIRKDKGVAGTVPIGILPW